MQQVERSPHPQLERCLHTTTRENRNHHSYRIESDPNKRKKPKPKLVSSHPYIATSQEPLWTSLLETSHTNTNWEEAPLQFGRNPEYTPNGEEPWVPCHGLSGMLILTLQLERDPEIPLQLERNLESPAATQEVARLPGQSGAPSPLLQLDKKPKFSAANSTSIYD